MAIKKIDYVEMPYAGRRFTPDTSRLGAILANQGEMLARIDLQKGRNTAELFDRLGQLWTGFQQVQAAEKASKAALALREKERGEERADKEKDRAEREAERKERQFDKSEAQRRIERMDAERRGAQIAEDVQYGPLAESQVDDVMAGPAASRARYIFGPGTANGPELQPSPSQQRGIAAEEAVTRMGGTIGPNGQVILPPKPTPTTLRVMPAMVNGKRTFVRVDPQGNMLDLAGRPVQAEPVPPANALPLPEEPPQPPADPNTRSILGQTGLTYNGFLTLTGRMSQLPRDRATRNAAAKEVQSWANTRGVDVSTFGSQYKALNDVLEKNIERFNNTRVAEGELAGTLDNLSEAATESGLDSVRAYNAAKLWLKGEVNDPDVQKYAFHLNQLRSELALYNAATQGRSGSGVLAQDFAEAERVLQQGIAAGSLTGLKTAIERSVEKMGQTLDKSVDRASHDVWKLFGVGEKYQPRVATPTSKTPPAIGATIEYDINGKPIKKP